MEFRDLQQYVDTLRIVDGEPFLELYLRALKMSEEIMLQQDKTGQHNRLIKRFVSLLFNVHPFTECMRPIMSAVTSFFKAPDNHLKDFPYTLQEMISKTSVLLEQLHPKQNMTSNNLLLHPPTIRPVLWYHEKSMTQ